jgi:DNA-binding response OmpR family regulator
MLPPDDDPRPRILHVEDDPDVLTVVAGIVGDLATVVPARDLAEARAFLNAARFDLMILDLTLPDGPGELLLTGTREEPGTSVPTIVFSVDAPSTEISGRLDAALLKSRTSNETLRAAIHARIAKEGASP